MVDHSTDNDQLLPLKVAAARVPGGAGKGVTSRTLENWRQGKIRGGIKLKTQLIGGRRHTSQKWINEFFAAIAAREEAAAT